MARLAPIRTFFISITSLEMLIEFSKSPVHLNKFFSPVRKSLLRMEYMIGLYIELAVKIQVLIKTTSAETLMLSTNWRRIPTMYTGRKHTTNALFVLSFSLTSLVAGFRNLQGFLFEIVRLQSDFLAVLKTDQLRNKITRMEGQTTRWTRGSRSVRLNHAAPSILVRSRKRLDCNRTFLQNLGLDQWKMEWELSK